MLTFRCFFVIIMLVFLSGVGCQKQKLPSDLPALFQTSITITQDGKPLPGATISLLQRGENAKWSAVGETNESGVAKKFFTNGMYEGVAAGKFKVCVRKIEKDQDEKQEIPPEPKDPFEKFQWRQKYIDNRPIKNIFDLVELKYNDPVKTPYEIEVSPSAREFSFDVGKSVRIQYKR